MRLDAFEYVCELRSLSDSYVKVALLASRTDKTSILLCDAHDVVSHCRNMDNYLLSFSYLSSLDRKLMIAKPAVPSTLHRV